MSGGNGIKTREALFNIHVINMHIKGLAALYRNLVSEKVGIICPSLRRAENQASWLENHRRHSSPAPPARRIYKIKWHHHAGANGDDWRRGRRARKQGEEAASASLPRHREKGGRKARAATK